MATMFLRCCVLMEGVHVSKMSDVVNYDSFNRIALTFLLSYLVCNYAVYLVGAVDPNQQCELSSEC